MQRNSGYIQTKNENKEHKNFVEKSILHVYDEISN